MSATATERPRPVVAKPRDATASAAQAPRPPRPPRPGASALPIALIASALIHVLVLGIRFTAAPLDRGAPAPTRLVEAVPGMRVLEVLPVAADVPTPQVVIDTRTAVPVLVVPPPAPTAPAAVAPATATPDRIADPSRTVTERIAPRASDPRLWSNAPDPLRPELDPLNNVRARVYGSIDAYNDSVAAALAAAERATDWTVRDANGGRWGVSPGQIHLGSISLPLPFGFAAPPGRRDEFNARQRTFTETQQQAARAEVEKSFDERVRAIRARKDAARDSARRGGGS